MRFRREWVIRAPHARVWRVGSLRSELSHLFGSHSRDDVDADSDIDLLMVEREPFGPGRSRRKEMARLWRALPPLTVGADILVYSSDEVERWRGSRNHVVGKALREGRVLYERP
ncbi:MAG: nucleotidyltransferase domain-containing protein [Thermoleophilia bacterium]